MIDARAIIDPSAKLGSNVEIGPWTIIGADVEIGDDSWVGSHVVIKGPTTIGRNNKIYQFASIGEDTPAVAYHGEATSLEIGDNNIFREGVTVHRGMTQDKGTTSVGNNGLFMAYVHIGHDCTVGDHVIMANNASVSGHCFVGDHANFGGYVGVPQFRYIGAYTHLAGMSLVLKDVPAYLTVGGNPASAVGMNVEGMRRRGYDKELISRLKEAYKVVYRKGLTVDAACEKLLSDHSNCQQIQMFVDSIRQSEVGIIRPRSARPT